MDYNIVELISSLSIVCQHSMLFVLCSISYSWDNYRENGKFLIPWKPISPTIKNVNE